MGSSSPSAEVYPLRVQHAPAERDDEDDTVGLLQSEEEVSSSDERLHLKRVDSPDEEVAGVDEHGDELFDGALSPLDTTLELIGMGRYQKTLLVLCGFGWMADNMWLQCIAVILPRVQEHYDVSDRWIGLLSASIFAGMMVGAWGWGSYSDSQGRTPAFNLTLLLTSIFGILSAFAPSFFWLCVALFGLGTGVGGSMPTDGTLFLENIPKSNHYLLTALSAFFSFGAVLTSLIGLYIIPRYSCPEHRLPEEVCDVDSQNLGWRYMLGALGVVSISMFLSRIVFFRLQESPKFLTASLRHSEAVIALQRISRINGQDRNWGLDDVVDPASRQASRQAEAEEEDGATTIEIRTTPPSPPESRRQSMSTPGEYDSTGEMRKSLSEERELREAEALQEEGQTLSGYSDDGLPHRISIPPLKARGRGRRKTGREWVGKLPHSMADSVDEYFERLDELFESKWKRTTVLMWSIWFLMSAGYTIFNVFLPKFLEAKVGETVTGGGREQSLREYVLYTASGIPGSFVGAWLVGTSLGGIQTLAISTLATSLGTLVFVLVSSGTGVMLSSMFVSLAATLMYAVLYAVTPQTFPTLTRGTATGIASALSRVAGVVAPIITGLLLSIDVSAPLFLSSMCFFVTAACAAYLPRSTSPQQSRNSTVLSH